MSVQAGTGCPASAGFDPLSRTYLADPYPTVAAVQRETPVFCAPAIDMWVVTRAPDIDAISPSPHVTN
ncbi:MAG: hypothetical protein ACR2LX_17340 [Jatrophihabitans sp.]